MEEIKCPSCGSGAVRKITEEKYECMACDNLFLVHNLSKEFQKTDEHIDFKINRLEQKKRSYNEDLNENLISENEYDNFIRRCNLQISALKKQLDKTSHKKTDNISSFDFGNTPAVINEMLKNNEISKPDRIILTQMVNCIYIYENNTVKIVYNVDHL